MRLRTPVPLHPALCRSCRICRPCREEIPVLDERRASGSERWTLDHPLKITNQHIDDELFVAKAVGHLGIGCEPEADRRMAGN